MSSKQLKYYLELMRIASNKHDYPRVLKYGKIAFKKLPLFPHSPAEEFLLYSRLGTAYSQNMEFSRAVDLFYKALLITSKPSFDPSYRIYMLARMGESLMMQKNIGQAIPYLEEVERYVQEYGSNTYPMNPSIYKISIISLGYCYLFKNELEKTGKLIEEKLPVCLEILPNDMSVIDCSHFRGEYLIAIGDYRNARLAFEECVALSNKIKFVVTALEAQIHIAFLDIMENRSEEAIKTLRQIMKEAKRFRISPLFAEAGLLLGKCYYLNNVPEKAVTVEQKIKTALDKVDTVWLFEKNREFENTFRQLKPPPARSSTGVPDIPDVLTRTLNDRYEVSPYKNIVGKSDALKEIFNLIEKIAPTDLPVLIQGETGTGKELIAAALHQNSRRCNENWLAFNCGALSETLIENELFGHARGAFTGAADVKKGYIELASGGTLFMDEIGDMSPAIQQKLLRVLEENQVWRIGAEKPAIINTRFIFASNQNIEQLSERKLFREDLFYRISAIIINLPPLRERQEDIPLLLRHFLARYSPTGRPMDVSQEALNVAMNYSWPGNIRELKNEIKRICVLNKDSGILQEAMFSPSLRAFKAPETHGHARQLTLKELRDTFDKKVLTEMLQKCDGNIVKVSRLLEYNRSTLYRRMKQLGLIQAYADKNEE